MIKKIPMKDMIHFENIEYIQREILSVLKILITISSTEIISSDDIIFIGIFKRCILPSKCI